MGLKAYGNNSQRGWKLHFSLTNNHTKASNVLSKIHIFFFLLFGCFSKMINIVITIGKLFSFGHPWLDDAMYELDILWILSNCLVPLGSLLWVLLVYFVDNLCVKPLVLYKYKRTLPIKMPLSIFLDWPVTILCHFNALPPPSLPPTWMTWFMNSP